MKRTVLIYTDKGIHDDIEDLGVPFEQALSTLAQAYMQDLELGVELPYHVHIDLDRDLYIFGGGPALDPKQIKL